jgi:hypothetical protein
MVFGMFLLIRLAQSAVFALHASRLYAPYHGYYQGGFHYAWGYPTCAMLAQVILVSMLVTAFISALAGLLFRRGAWLFGLITGLMHAVMVIAVTRSMYPGYSGGLGSAVGTLAALAMAPVGALVAEAVSRAGNRHGWSGLVLEKPEVVITIGAAPFLMQAAVAFLRLL